ncbi:MAG: DUF309 domain-containing protein [Bacteriovoracaceae bacterium]
MNSKLIRFLPEKDLPSYRFVPGVNPHPKKTGGHMEHEEEPMAEKVDLLMPQKNESLRYALDLFNHGYFWESHVYFEALWNAHGRIDDVAIFSQAMIKLGAAGVKLAINQDEAATGHLERAQELFVQLQTAHGTNFLGFSLNTILEQIKLSLEGELKLFPVYPLWD